MISRGEQAMRGGTVAALGLGMSSSRSFAALLALLLSTQACVMQKVEDLADRYIPEANPKAPATLVCEARPTTRVELSGNLSQLAPPVAGFRSELAPAQASFHVDSTLYGEHANPVDVTLYFAAQGDGAWLYGVQSRDPSAAHVVLAEGRLQYDADGALIALEPLRPLRLPRANGALGANVELWLGTPKSASSDGLDGMISTTAASSVAALDQDGHAEYRDVVCADERPLD